MVQGLPSMYETLGSMPSTTKKMSRVLNLRVQRDTANPLTQGRFIVGLMSDSVSSIGVRVVRRRRYINADEVRGARAGLLRRA